MSRIMSPEDISQHVQAGTGGLFSHIGHGGRHAGCDNLDVPGNRSIGRRFVRPRLRVLAVSRVGKYLLSAVPAPTILAPTVSAPTISRQCGSKARAGEGIGLHPQLVDAVAAAAVL